MPLQLTAPSKTFLLGEYLALHGGPSLVITHAPHFNLETKLSNQHSLEGISPLSPAGRYIQDNIEYFHSISLAFNDPHQGKGGFGASTAQFLLAYALQNNLQQHSEINFQESIKSSTPPRVIPAKAGIHSGNSTNIEIDSCFRGNDSVNLFDLDFSNLLHTYISYAWNGTGLKPSGADLIAQAIGGIALFSQNPWQLKPYAWPFADMSFMIVKTPQKLATHHHLAELTTFNSTELKHCMEAALKAFRTSDSQVFAECVNQYAELLAQSGFVVKETLILIDLCKRIPGVLAVKGCGALGADTLLILSTITAKPLILEWCQQHGLQWDADEMSIKKSVIAKPATRDE